MLPAKYHEDDLGIVGHQSLRLLVFTPLIGFEVDLDLAILNGIGSLKGVLIFEW